MVEPKPASLNRAGYVPHRMYPEWIENPFFFLFFFIQKFFNQYRKHCSWIEKGKKIFSRRFMYRIENSSNFKYIETRWSATSCPRLRRSYFTHTHTHTLKIYGKYALIFGRVKYHSPHHFSHLSYIINYTRISNPERERERGLKIIMIYSNEFEENR